MEFTDIPFELILNTFEFLDLKSLANVAQTNRYHQKAAETIFNIKYGKNRFIINGNNSAFYSNFHQFGGLMKAIEMFGHLITKLTLDYVIFDDDKIEAINKQLSKYTARSLVEIDLRHCYERNFFGLSGPFKRARIVCLRDSFMGAKYFFNFREIFPAVRSWINVIRSARKYRTQFSVFKRAENGNVNRFDAARVATPSEPTIT